LPVEKISSPAEPALTQEEALKAINEITGDISKLHDKDALNRIKEKLDEHSELAPFAGDTYSQITMRLEKLTPVYSFEDNAGRIRDLTEEELSAFCEEFDRRRGDIDEKTAANIDDLILAREDALEVLSLEKLCGNTDNMTTTEIEKLLETLADGSFSVKAAAPYIKTVREKLDALYVKEADRLTANTEMMNAAEIAKVREHIAAMKLPDDIKKRIEGKLDRASVNLDEKEIQNMIGSLTLLSEKQALEIIRRIDMMKSDKKMTDRYVDKLEAHIIKLRETEAQDFTAVITASMQDSGMTNAQIIMAGSALFPNKVNKATSEYASVGRYEQSLIVSENTKTEESLLLTTDFIYMRTKTGTINRIKVEDVDDIRFEKAFIGNPKIICKAKSETVELPHGFDKKSSEAAAVVLLDVINAIKDKKSADRMKAIEEANAKRKAIAQAAAEAEQKLLSGTKEKEAPKRVIKNPAETEKRGVEIDLSEIEADLEALVANLETKAAFKNVEESGYNEGFDTVNTADMHEATTGAKSLDDQSASLPANDHHFDGIEVPSLDDMDSLEDKAPFAEEIKEPEPVEKEPEPAVKEPEPMAEITEDRQKPKFCPECGAKVEITGAKFCMECGFKLV
jgi:hypothetical protein